MLTQLSRHLADHYTVSNEFPGGKTTGPSYGRLPNFAGDMINWFTEWASAVAANNAVPDMISLHFLYADGDLQTSISQYLNILSAAGINYQGTWNVQEYGNIDQQFPSTCVWNIAQLERHNAPGLRANWRGEYELHDYLANLISKPEHYPNYVETADDYYPAREYPVYIYYHQKMKGTRVATNMTDDTLGDTFAVINPVDRRVRILAGTRPVTGTWSIRVNGLSAVGLPAEGQLPIQTWRFNSAQYIYDPVSGPDDLGYYTHEYSDDSVFFYVGQEDPNVAYAFEFSY